MPDSKKQEGTQNKMENVKKEAGERIGKITRAAEKELQKIKKQASHQIDNFDELVKKNPKSSVLVSAGVGALFGIALAVMISNKTKK